MNQTSNTKSPKKNASKPTNRRWFRWVLVLSLSFLGIAAVAHFSVRQVVKQKFAKQLEAAFAGPIEIQSAGLTWDGAYATNISLRTDQKSTKPWLNIGSVSAKASLSDLLAGKSPEVLSLDDVELNLELDQQGNLPDLPFNNNTESSALPAPQIELRDTTITLSQPNRQSLVLEEVQADLVQSDQEIKLDSQAKFAGSVWTLTGTTNQTQSDFLLKTPRWQVDSQQLQNVPMIPPSIIAPLQFQGNVQPTVTITSSENKAWDVQADLIPSNLQFAVPKFDLELVIENANVHFDNSLMTVTDAIATMDGGKIKASGKTQFNLPQATGDFQAELQDLPLDSIHTLASIPTTAQGTYTGSGTGHYEVNRDTGFHLDLSTKGDLSNASYQDLPLEPSKVSVEIAGLELKQNSYEFLSLAGQVDIDTAAKQLNLQKFFTNMGLLDDSNTKLAAQLGGETDADIAIGIPLATASNLRSWTLEAKTTSGTIDLASQKLKRVGSTIKFVDGKVAVQKLVGIGPHNSASAASPSSSTPNEQPTSSDPPPAPSSTATSLTTTASDDKSTPSDDDAEHLIYVSGTWPLPTAGKNDISEAIQDGPQSNQDTPDDQDQFEQANQDPTDDQPESLNATEDDHAEFEIEGSEVSVQWLLSIAKDYNVDVANIIQQFLPDANENLQGIDGHLTLDAKLKIPTATASDFSTWDVQVEIVSGDISYSDQHITDLKGTFSLREQVVTLNKISGNLPQQQQIFVDASVPLDTTKAANIEAKLPALPVQVLVAVGRQFSPEFNQVASQLGFDQQPPVSGNLQLALNLKRPAADENNPNSSQAWNANVDFSSQELTIKNKPLQSLDGQVTVDSTSVTIPKLDLIFEDGSHIKTKGKWPIGKNSNDAGQLEVETIKVPIQWVLDLVPTSSATISRFDDKIQFSMSDQSLAQFKFWDDPDAQQTQCPDPSGFGDYFSNSQLTGKLIVRQTEANSLSTTANFTATSVSLQFGRSHIDSEPLALDLSGQIQTDDWGKSDLTLKVDSKSGRWNDQDVSDLSAVIRLANQVTTIKASAELLEGQLRVNGQIPLQAPDDTQILNDASRETFRRELAVALSGIHMRSLFYAIFGSQPQTVDGSLDSEMTFLFVDQDVQVEQGNVTIKQLDWQRNRVSDSLQADFGIQNNILQVKNIQGDLAGGRAGGRMQVAIQSGFNGDYELNLQRTNLRIVGQSLHKISPNSDLDSMEGFADVQIRGNLGRNINGVGTIGLTDAMAFDLGVKNLKLPVRFQINPSDLAGKIEFRQSQFRALGGSIHGKAKLAFGRRLDIEVDADLTRIDSDQLIGSLAGRQSLGQGQVFGKLKLDGRSVRSIRDLDGQFVGRVERTRSFQIPLLRNLAVFLNSGQLTQKQFDSDDVLLRLDHGRLKVERLTFVSDAAQLFITGAVSTEGHLDLDVAARIANLSGNRQLYERLTGSPIAALANPAGVAVTGITEFLSNRVIYLHIGGTANHPNFRVQTGRLLSEQVVQQFFSSIDPQIVANLSASR